MLSGTGRKAGLGELAENTLGEKGTWGKGDASIFYHSALIGAIYGDLSRENRSLGSSREGSIDTSCPILNS